MTEEYRALVYEDFTFFCENEAKVPGRNDLVPCWPFRDAQERIWEVALKQWEAEGLVRLIIEKSRKMGSSTIIQLLNAWLCQKFEYFRSLTVAQSDDDTQELFQIPKVCWESMSPDVRVPLRTGRSEITQGNVIELANGSRLTCRTQGGSSTGKGRGGSPRFVHASEVPSWEHNRKSTSTDDLAAALLSSVETEANTFIFVESTPKGAHGLFYDLWRQAYLNKRGNIYKAVFLAWHQDRRYVVVNNNPLVRAQRAAQARGLVEAAEREDTAEREFYRLKLGFSELQATWMVRYKLTVEQVDFWQQKLVNDCKSNQDRFNEEFPVDWEVGFASTGGKFFPPAVIQARVLALRDYQPASVGAFASAGAFRRHEEGFWWLHGTPMPGRTYVISADAAGGGQTEEDDYAAAIVLDVVTGDQIAVLRARIGPEELADQVAWASRYFNDAEVGPENLGHGLAVIQRLRDRHPLVPLWHRAYDPKTTRWLYSETIGFATNTTTRPLVFDTFRSDWLEGRIVIHDLRVLEDMLSIINKRGRGPEAAGTKDHDDTVIASGIACIMRWAHRQGEEQPEEKPTPAQPPPWAAATFSFTDTSRVDDVQQAEEGWA